MGLTIKVDGLSALDDRLRSFGSRIAANGLRSSAYAGAKVMLEAVRESAPIRTGLLKANLVTKRRRTPAHEAKYSIVVKTVQLRHADTKLNRRLRRVGRKYRADGPAFYAKFIEYGSSNMGARAFMRPAFKAKSGGPDDPGSGIAAVKRGLERAVEREARRR